jgi:glycosyltransferase involved in cell wall biosynthesis
MTVNKVDLAMWAKNGEQYLPSVLKRIDEVIPNEDVNRKIFVDDHSKDNSVKIAKDFNWNVYPNKKGMVFGGFLEAIKRVESEYFVSVEQDVLLAKDWWEKIPRYMDTPNVACAQGIPVPTHKILRAIFLYGWMRAGKPRKRLLKLLKRVNKRRRAQEQYVSLDNNLFRTKIVKEVGIPTYCPISVDLALFSELRKRCFRWITAYNVVSDHIRFSFLGEIRHNYTLNLLSSKECGYDVISLKKFLSYHVSRSIPTGLFIAYDTNCPEVCFAYPFIYLMDVKTFIHRKSVLRNVKKVLPIEHLMALIDPKDSIRQ